MRVQRTYVCACVRVCTRVSDTCAHTCICVHTCMYAHVLGMCMCAYVYMYVHVCLYTCQVRVCVHTCVYAHVYIHTEPRQGSLSQPQDQTPSDAVGLHPGSHVTSTFESLLGISPLLPSLPLSLGPLPQAGPFTLAPAPTQGPAHHCSVNGVELMKDPTWSKPPKKQL